MIRSLSAVFLGAVLAFGQVGPAPLHIAGKEEYPSCTLVKLAAENVPPGAVLRWKVIPDKGVMIADTAPERCQFVAPPGVYRVELLAVAVVDGKPVLAEATRELRIGPGQPPAPKGGTADALGKIQFGNAGCTATVVQPRRQDGRWEILTAAHCVEQVGQRGTFASRAVPSTPVRVTARDKRVDVAWLLTDRDDLGDIPAALLAENVPPVGTKVWQQGFSPKRAGERQAGILTHADNLNGMLGFDLLVNHGDSGGAIFNETTGEVLSPVCCSAEPGRFTRVYGGSPLEARRLRPRTATMPDEQWTPLIMPRPRHGE